MNYIELRQKYPEFTYKSFSYEIVDKDLIIKFLFRIGSEIEFRPTIKYKNIDFQIFKKIDASTISNFVFNLGLAEIPSYWKSTCSPKITIEAGYLDNYQLEWWKNLLINGMGQFFYENKIDFTIPNFISLTTTSGTKYESVKSVTGRGQMIPVGGGKDSAVTLELLNKENNTSAFLLNPQESTLKIISAAGVTKNIIVERKIDLKLLELNSSGFLNGHTPFSSLIAFLSIFAAQMYGYDEIILSNERSSDEENTEYLGHKINHQFSKTFVFENLFREYSKKYLTAANYFSLLRPIYEIQIAKIFSTMPKYFQVFRSCNVGQKTDSWCGNCSKCLSTYILLSPFLRKSDLIKIFKSDLINKESLETTLKDLTEEGRVKPFECVGTRRELRDAIDGNLELLNEWNEGNNLPEKYGKLLRTKI